MRAGRPWKTTANEDHYITLTSRRNRFASTQRIADQFYRTRITAATVRNRLHAA